MFIIRYTTASDAVLFSCVYKLGLVGSRDSLGSIRLGTAKSQVQVPRPLSRDGRDVDREDEVLDVCGPDFGPH
jgi:hypothetical protein